MSYDRAQGGNDGGAYRASRHDRKSDDSGDDDDDDDDGDGDEAKHPTPPEFEASLAPMLEKLVELDEYSIAQWSARPLAGGRWAEVKIYLRRR